MVFEMQIRRRKHFVCFLVITTTTTTTTTYDVRKRLIVPNTEIGRTLLVDATYLE
jgi:hypothetical protein